MSATPFEQLEQQIEQLLAYCQELEQRNQLLSTRESQWKQERAQLLRARDSIQAKVEAMINRLKDLEKD